MLFLFDYGDNWKFVVELIQFGDKKKSEISSYFKENRQSAKTILIIMNNNDKNGHWKIPKDEDFTPREFIK